MIGKLLKDLRNLLDEVDLDKLTAADAYTIQTLIKILDSGVITRILEGLENE